MRDLHVADVGDFGKFGLLRWLVGPDDLGRQLTLGVIWYYWKESAFSYMDPPDPNRGLALLDIELFHALERLAVPRTRMVESLENMRLLPPDTVYFRDVIPNGKARAQWFEDARDAMEDRDVVFLDPDIGLKEDAKSEHASFTEAAQLWKLEKSLVIYQSFGRDGSHEEQILSHGQKLREKLEIDGPAGEIIALRFGRRLPRVFFVIPNTANREVAQLLRERVDSFMASCWGDHFTRVDC